VPITHVDTNTKLSTGATSLVLDKPTGATTDDVIVCAIGVSSDGTFPDITAPDGTWTQVTDVGFASVDPQNQKAAVFYKVVPASDSGVTTYTFSIPASRALCGVITAYRGVDTRKPLGGVPFVPDTEDSVDTTILCQGITTTASLAYYVLCSWIDGNRTATTAGMTKRGETGVSGMSVALFDEVRSVAGATGTRSVVWSGGAIASAIMGVGIMLLPKQPTIRSVV
jgi:hypothetical protein